MSGWGDFITCQSCGQADHETTDYPRGLRFDGDSAAWTCGNCGAESTVTLSVSYAYQTVAARSAGPDTPGEGA